jgi:hypothetical protein
MELPVDRTSSSIPRPNSEEKVWEYPSPQQFYNALVRKGWETPEEHVETMVEIHNFLNEEAWQEVMKWEKRLPKWVIADLPSSSVCLCGVSLPHSLVAAHHKQRRTSSAGQVPR